MRVTKRNGNLEDYIPIKQEKAIDWSCHGIEGVSADEVKRHIHSRVIDKMKTADLHDEHILSAAGLISESNPNYTYVAARALLQKIYKEITGGPIQYPHIREFFESAIQHGQIKPEVVESYDLDRLNKHIRPERDFNFKFQGLQILYDRYFIRESIKYTKEPKVIEMPQQFYMRVAMGLNYKEDESVRHEKCIETYDLLSMQDYSHGTPTMFNSAKVRSQLSSCFISEVPDDLGGIYDFLKDTAYESKYTGGCGSSWSRIRSMGSPIVGTNGVSSGSVPFLKLYNDTAIAVNQGGKRAGALAPYLEPWHADWMDFIQLKRNTGEERLRTHEVFPAAWICDLLMKRKTNDEMWSFFSPYDCPELVDAYGDEFERLYMKYEAEGLAVKTMPAKEVWHQTLTSLFETGNPWICFKDEVNRRSPQKHIGTVHSSNLCTEITLVTKAIEEVAVCNLASVNVSKIPLDPIKEREWIRRVVRTAHRNLDNVIDINFYPHDRARDSNMRHRPIGLGIMGYTEYLVARGIDWESEEHLKAADRLMELISYELLSSSVDLAIERGPYPSFAGSDWSKGILPIDTAIDQETVLGMDVWNELRARIMKHGVRNSNHMAIAPTATIGNIVGTTACIEPAYERATQEEAMSGFFTIIDPCLKYGRPELCKYVYEINPTWVIRAASRRQKWIDQAQSVNIFLPRGITFEDFDNIYTLAWLLRLKTTYYAHVKQEETIKTRQVTFEDHIFDQEEDEPPFVQTQFSNAQGITCEGCQ